MSRKLSHIRIFVRSIGGSKQVRNLWIEYYHKRANEIEAAIRKSQLTGTDPPVDKWVVLDMPSNLYYHKYLMYNVGIVASAGKIVTFCDSDGIVSENFVNSIIASFNQDPNIVLHMDQVRNGEKKTIPLTILRSRKSPRREK